MSSPEPMYCSRFANHGSHVFYAGSVFAVCCGRTRTEAERDRENMARGQAVISEVLAEVSVRRGGRAR